MNIIAHWRSGRDAHRISTRKKDPTGRDVAPAEAISVLKPLTMEGRGEAATRSLDSSPAATPTATRCSPSTRLLSARSAPRGSGRALPGLQRLSRAESQGRGAVAVRLRVRTLSGRSRLPQKRKNREDDSTTPKTGGSQASRPSSGGNPTLVAPKRCRNAEREGCPAADSKDWNPDQLDLGYAEVREAASNRPSAGGWLLPSPLA